MNVFICNHLNISFKVSTVYDYLGDLFLIQDFETILLMHYNFKDQSDGLDSSRGSGMQILSGIASDLQRCRGEMTWVNWRPQYLAPDGS